ncbi:hypothetical protein [Streptococcus sp. DD13]|uniref:hypothetical protein n=1 Tax=Streptococcus sp. DD13 TaxID=1777881 RepID=UPI000792DE28|nr:hypothetical protein [Streptococcus sp. DD13]KXT79091.1 hypothetical protein STRDD13_00210 [Streptococcus sp. DD13]
MLKWIRRGILLSLIALIGLACLLIPDRVNPSDQLQQVQTEMSLASLVQDLSADQIDLTSQTATIRLRTGRFNQYLKSLIGQLGSRPLNETAYSLEGDYLRLQTPVQLGPIESKLDMEFSVSVVNQHLVLRAVHARLGKMPLPTSLVLSLIKGQLIKGNPDLVVDQSDIQLSLTSRPFEIREVSITDGEATFVIGLQTN